jgi:hypothetical protein
MLGYNFKDKHVIYVTLNKNKQIFLKHKVFIEIINYNILFLLFHIASTYFLTKTQNSENHFREERKINRTPEFCIYIFQPEYDVL